MSSRSDENRAVKETMSTGTAMGPMSRASLYKSLASYNDAEDSERSSALTTSRSQQDSSLIEFLQRVSDQYHRLLANPGDAKNTAGRPLSKLEITEKIRQRTLTLVGGGFNRKISSKTSGKRSLKLKLSSRKRKREQRRLPNNKCRFDDSDSSVEQCIFLLRLKALWDEYVWGILKREGVVGQVSMDQADAKDGSKSFDLTKCMKIFSCTVMEWIGARVAIQTCKQCESWKGLEGIIVGATKRVWKISTIKRKRNDERNDRRKRETMTIEELEKWARTATMEMSESDLQVCTLLVPKRDSSLNVIFSMDRSVPSPSSRTSPNEKSKGKGIRDPKLPYPTQNLCIILRNDH